MTGREYSLEARRDNGTFVTSLPGQEAAISSGWHRLRLAWQSGPGTGSLSLFLDGVAAGQLSGLVNGTRRVDIVEWGVAGGALSGTSGFLDLDTFSSWR